LAEINLGNFKSALGIFVNVIELCHAGKIDKAQRAPGKGSQEGFGQGLCAHPWRFPGKGVEFFERMGGDYAPRCSSRWPNCTGNKVCS